MYNTEHSGSEEYSPMMIAKPLGTGLLHCTSEYKLFAHRRHHSHHHNIGQQQQYATILFKKHGHHFFGLQTQISYIPGDGGMQETHW